tara:strand:- start:4628 stop:7195 length:2568 start_codon:yes stop_codon:yes gene_type:complete
MTNLNKIRTEFLDFFKKNGHTVVQSSPVIPQNDPTLMFVNAGMVPFKDYFTGNQKPENKKAASSQKCVRAGGKHNDLDNVGHTARHLTFFEMLGNFSFGDYFKEEAIKLAWELLTNKFDIPKNRLLITVFNEDEEAFNLWKKISGFSDEKIIKISSNDNFWSMGSEGPCGPCSEIFYDHGESVFGGPPGSKDEDGDRFVEIWNLVFMQYLKKQGQENIALPKPSIDTGMGLERMSAVLQGKVNSFEIDVFESLISDIEEITKIKTNDENIASFRIIADHLRSISFLIADGVIPSNEGRGYVLRRIMRRAMRHSHKLGFSKPILFELSKSVINLMNEPYRELIRAEKLINITLLSEEEKFLSTLSRGLKILEEESRILQSGDIFNGKTAFKLYDTYGFPVDLTEDLLRDKNLSLDIKQFNASMKKQKEKAKKSWLGSGDKKTEKIWFEVSNINEGTEFLGYDNFEASAQVKSIIFKNKLVEKIEEGEEAILVFNQSPFYAESGGQVGDTGLIFGENTEFIVTDTKKKMNNLHAHFGYIKKGRIEKNDILNLKINKDNRNNISFNHSSTHLLHEALRRVLGEHVTQKGSQINAKKFRFDFSHNNPIDYNDLIKIESIVNDQIDKNTKVVTEILSYDEAIERGALALFGEKYGEIVRMCTMGEDNFSIELCGGTHVQNLGEIGSFKLTSQSSVASGIRRLEAVTGSMVNTSDSLIEKILTQKKAKEDKKLNKKSFETLSKSVLNGEIFNLGNVSLFFDSLENVGSKNLRFLIDECKKDFNNSVICIIGSDNNKVSIAIGITDDLIDDYDAVELVKIVSEVMKGKGGGGRRDMALGGGTDIRMIEDAKNILIKKIQNKG